MLLNCRNEPKVADKLITADPTAPLGVRIAAPQMTVNDFLQSHIESPSQKCEFCFLKSAVSLEPQDCLTSLSAHNTLGHDLY